MIKHFLYSCFVLCLFSCAAQHTYATPPASGNEVPAGRIVKVSTAAQLKKALSTARPGDDIQMEDGNYSGKFKIPPYTSGTSKNPIMLSGSEKAILDAGDITTGYVLSLESDYWHLKGFTLTNGLKGLMADSASNNIIDGIYVHDVGEEGIHLRKFSSNNIIRNVRVENTGLKTPDYGEGIYIGSAKSNWKKYTNNMPDKCDNNIVENCHLGPNITAECIDIKEGTTGGIIRNNVFDAKGISGENAADSWIDVKGNKYLIENNTGENTANDVFKDGYQVHVAIDGWGNDNVFKNNVSNVNGPGYGFNIQLKGSNGTTKGNIVYNNNKVTGAEKGISNIELTKE